MTTTGKVDNTSMENKGCTGTIDCFLTISQMKSEAVTRRFPVQSPERQNKKRSLVHFLINTSVSVYEQGPHPPQELQCLQVRLWFTLKSFQV